MNYSNYLYAIKIKENINLSVNYNYLFIVCPNLHESAFCSCQLDQFVQTHTSRLFAAASWICLPKLTRVGCCSSQVHYSLPKLTRVGCLQLPVVLVCQNSHESAVCSRQLYQFVQTHTSRLFAAASCISLPKLTRVGCMQPPVGLVCPNSHESAACSRQLYQFLLDTILRMLAWHFEPCFRHLTLQQK